MPDYLPANDAEFNAWQVHFLTELNADLAGHGLVPGDVAAVNAQAAIWTAAFTAHVAAQAQAESATQAKKTARTAHVALIRDLVARLQASPQVSDAERAALGITVPGAGPGIPSGPPTGIPLLTVECSRLQHVLRWTDSMTPTKRAKPPGCIGVEIRRKLTAVGDPTPTDPDTFQITGVDTATPHMFEYNAPDGGKNAHYIARWINTTGQHGTWSETVTVTIGA